MRNEVTVTHINCDICGKDMEDVYASESTPLVVDGIRVSQYYGATRYLKDICSKCNSALAETLKGLMV